MPNVELVTKEWGDGDRRALLMHGISSSAAGWWRVGPDLANLGYHVVAPDLRGHGDSPRATEMSIEDYCGDILALGDDWDLVLGHSLGGAIALSALSVVPGWTKRLILQDPALLGANAPDVVALLLSDYEEPITGERVARSNPHWNRTDAEIKAEALRQSSPEVVYATIRDGKPWNFWDVLVGLEMPTLLIGADPGMGALVAPIIGQAAAAENPMIKFHVVAGGSHSMHRDEYDAYWALVREFVA